MYPLPLELSAKISSVLDRSGIEDEYMRDCLFEDFAKLLVRENRLIRAYVLTLAKRFEEKTNDNNDLRRTAAYLGEGLAKNIAKKIKQKTYFDKQQAVQDVIDQFYKEETDGEEGEEKGWQD